MTIVIQEQGNILDQHKNVVFKYCYIFDYSIGKIYEIEIPSKITTNYKLEEYLEDEYGLKLSNIEYMTSLKKLKIENYENN